ncbi:hypothetical protein QBC33DRAFT_427287, partial [Phialemonium atrogriseum]
SPTVIVFGATGSVGSATARAAQQQGAKVFLAVRDLNKPIPGLSASEESARGFQRVTADLLQPETVRAAAAQAQATRAFVYLAHFSPDHMRATLEALRSGGVDFVVFLSTASIVGDPRAAPQSDYISHSHAQVELGLAEVFGPRGFVAVRPAYFASNSLRWAAGIRAGDAGVLYPEAKFDFITSGDIGRVSGALLAGEVPPTLEGEVGAYSALRIHGPKLVSQGEAVAIIGKEIGRDIKVTALSEEEGIKAYTDLGLPEPIARQLVDMIARRHRGDDGNFYEGPAAEEAVANVEKYSKAKPQQFEEWVRENKQAFI